MKKTLRIFIILFCLLILITGCSTTESIPVNLDFNNDNILTIGVDDQFPPLSYLDENSNIIGFDIDLANLAAQKLGLELKIQPINWSQKEEELKNGNIDAIWSGLSITPERTEQILFTDPYLTTNQVVLVRNESEINDINDLSGKIVGIQNSSSSEDALGGNPVISTIKTVIPYDEALSAIDDLNVGRIDAVVIDSVLADWYLKNKNSELKILTEPLSTGEYAVGVSPDNYELLTQLNNVLDEIKTDGSGVEISTKWFGENVLYYPQ